MNRARQISIFKRGLCLNAAVSLLMFLVLSAPHRVHHFFDQLPSLQSIEIATANVHDHGDSRHDHHSPLPLPAPQQSDCVILTATQNAQALAPSSCDFSIFSEAVERAQPTSIDSALSFNPSLPSQRAPPRL
jgi:hypothetical protein